MNAPPSTEALWKPRRASGWRSAAAVVVLSLVISAFAWWTALSAYPLTQGGDGHFNQSILEAGAWSILRYHEFPGWNPYDCGGVPLWDNPQAFLAAPLAWLTFIVGSTRTIEIWYVLHGALGFLGMWALLRGDLKLSRIACFVGAAMWAWNGFHQQHYGRAGHLIFVPFEYFPFALFLWRRAEKDLRYAVGMGLLVAWMMFEGAAYPLPHLALVLGIESLFRTWPASRSLAMGRAAVVVIGVALLVGGCRFFPVVHQLRIHTRGASSGNEHVTWMTLKAMFLAHEHSSKVHGEPWRWHEYGGYVGPFLLTLSILGLVVGALEYPWLVAIFAICFLLMLGSFAKWAPWPFLHAHVFPFKEMRVPSRFIASVLVCLSAFAAIAIDRIPERLKRYKLHPGHVRSALALFALIGVGDVLGAGRSPDIQSFHSRPRDTRISVSHALYLEGEKHVDEITMAAQNRGRFGCFDEWAFETWTYAHGHGEQVSQGLWSGNVPQIRASDPDVAKITGPRRTQNSFAFEVDATQPTRVRFNTSYDDGWRSDVGVVVRDTDKLLAVDIPAGKTHVRVHYWPHGLTAGLISTGLSIPLLALYFIWDARTRARRLRAAAVATDPSP